MENFILIASYTILFYFASLTIGYCILLFASLSDILRQFKEADYGNISDVFTAFGSLPILTVIVPVWNEKTRVFNTIYSLVKSDYSPINITLVNDASTDNTMDLLIQKFQLYVIPTVIKQTIKTQPIRATYRSTLYPNLLVIDKGHGFGNGADSINVGINACNTPLYMTVDADTIVEPQAISRLLFNFFSKPHCVVVGGAVYVLNGNEVQEGVMVKTGLPSETVAAFQAVEYIRSFLFGRAGWNTFSGALCYAGAFTLFEKQVVVDMGGLDAKNFAYDAEVVTHIHDYMRRHKYPYTAYFTSNAFAWTEVPATIKHYWKQRNFWQRGMLRTFTKHSNMFFNPRYGIVGMFNVPFNFFYEIMGSVVEFLSYMLLILALIFSTVAVKPLVWALILAAAFSAFINLANFFLNIITYKKYHNFYDTLRVVYLVTLEMFGFRQIRAACCFVGTMQYIWNRLRGRPV
ncbi:MAG: glycosyltransferase family 2 protein [Gammaproteobacteria bacterium]|nr:glycosyltransferase family 2 protein [Gammaproteobacteria bacterium]